MLHKKTDGIATSAAAKTFINFLRRRNCKRRCFFVVKRTKAKIICASFFQFHKSADDFGDIDAAEDLLYGLW